MPEPEPPPFAMRVPLGGGHWISIQSNKPMTPEAWKQFNRHLDLQHDIWAEGDAASGMEAPSGGETVQLGSTEGDSPVVSEASETPTPSSAQPGDA